MKTQANFHLHRLVRYNWYLSEILIFSCFSNIKIQSPREQEVSHKKRPKPEFAQLQQHCKLQSVWNTCEIQTRQCHTSEQNTIAVWKPRHNHENDIHLDEICYENTASSFVHSVVQTLRTSACYFTITIDLANLSWSNLRTVWLKKARRVFSYTLTETPQAFASITRTSKCDTTAPRQAC